MFQWHMRVRVKPHVSIKVGEALWAGTEASVAPSRQDRLGGLAGQFTYCLSGCRDVSDECEGLGKASG